MITRVDRTLVSKQIEAEVRNYFGPLVNDRSVPASVKFREAYARGIPLIHYDRLSPAAAAYHAAASAFLNGRGKPKLDADDATPQEGDPKTVEDPDPYYREAS